MGLLKDIVDRLHKRPDEPPRCPQRQYEHEPHDQVFPPAVLVRLPDVPGPGRDRPQAAGQQGVKVNKRQKCFIGFTSDTPS